MPSVTSSDKIKGCCTPTRGETYNYFAAETISRPSSEDLSKHAVLIPGGKGLVGTQIAGITDDGETPLRKVTMKPFWMSPTVVTNA